MPISGKFRLTSIRLPGHIDTVKPQNSYVLLAAYTDKVWNFVCASRKDFRVIIHCRNEYS